MAYSISFGLIGVIWARCFWRTSPSCRFRRSFLHERFVYALTFPTAAAFYGLVITIGGLFFNGIWL